nr:type VII secretion integral membrane protein EccD [Tessaracoccus sp. OS52]
MSRVTIISQSRRVDLALPGSVTLSELLPSILRFSGLEPNTPTDAVHAWVLQRFGADPFDLYTPVGKLNIRDGETLHLRQRENAIPDAAFDDVVDAVAGATNSRPSWAARHSRTMGLVLMMVLLIGASLLSVNGAMAVQGLALLLAVALTGFLGFATFIAAVALARAAGERPTATCLAWTSVALAGITGWFLPNLIAVEPIPIAIRILMAGALVLVAASASALAARVHAMPLFAVALTAGFMLISASAMALNYGHDAEVAAITLGVMAVLTGFLPAFSYRLAGIAMPNLTVNTEAMLADQTPVQHDIVERALLADRILAAVLAATSATAVLSALLVLQQGSLWALALCLCTGLAFLLRARAFVGLAQRMALLLGGTLVTALAMFALAAPATRSTTGVLILFAGVLVLGYVLAHYSASTYARIISPSWGRWGDIFEWLAIMGIVPALLGVLDLYTYFRSLFG